MKYTLLALAAAALVAACVAWYVFWPRHKVWVCDQAKCSEMSVSSWRMWNAPGHYYKSQAECQVGCAPEPLPPLVEETNVSYGPSPIHVMDTYRLPRQAQSTARPLVLVHGGGMVKGGKGEAREVSIARDMARVGFDVYVPSYTLGTNSWPQNLDDVTMAVQFVTRANGPKVVLMGLSAGGTLALLCGIANPGLVSVVVSMYGITSPADRTYSDNPDKFRPGHIHQVVGTSRCVSCRSRDVKHRRDERCSENRNASCLADVWLDVSPVEQLRRQGKMGASALPRFVLVHGDKDGIVNPNQASLFSDAHASVMGGSSASSPAVRVIRVPNGQHGFNLSKNRDGTPLEATDLRRSIVDAIGL